MWVGVCVVRALTPFSSYIIIHSSAECSRDIDKDDGEEYLDNEQRVQS